MDLTKRQLLDDENYRFWNLLIVVLLVALACVVGLIGFQIALVHEDALTPEPRLFMRLVAVEGLGVDDVDDDPWEPPVFELAVDVDTIPEESLLRGPRDVGGGDAMLRVSYRGVILAWGSVPRFTIDGKRQGRYAPGVATVLAKAEGSVVREAAEFVDVDRELSGIDLLSIQPPIHNVLSSFLHACRTCAFAVNMDETKRRSLADDDDFDYGPPVDAEFDCLLIVVFSLVFACLLCLMVVQFALAIDDALTPEPRLFMRLVAVEGLWRTTRGSPRSSSWPWTSTRSRRSPCSTSPAALGAGTRRCGCRTAAWSGQGTVPRFTIDGKRQGRYAPGVATVLAKAEGSVVREVMRNLIRAELQALGSAEFVVDGELRGFGGHISCKTYLFDGEPTMGLPPCAVQKKAGSP
ncbi:hypothetical protein EJB05_17629, partial [Eragrostis curvula]